jgi:hypothetical protein
MNYQLALLKPGKFPLFDFVRNTKREYFVSLTVLQLRPDLTQRFFCFVIVDILEILIKLK